MKCKSCDLELEFVTKETVIESFDYKVIWKCNKCRQYYYTMIFYEEWFKITSNLAIVELLSSIYEVFKGVKEVPNSVYYELKEAKDLMNSKELVKLT